jgi:hypothetical protein
MSDRRYRPSEQAGCRFENIRFGVQFPVDTWSVQGFNSEPSFIDSRKVWLVARCYRSLFHLTSALLADLQQTLQCTTELKKKDRAIAILKQHPASQPTCVQTRILTLKCNTLTYFLCSLYNTVHMTQWVTSKNPWFVCDVTWPVFVQSRTEVGWSVGAWMFSL